MKVGVIDYEKYPDYELHIGDEIDDCDTILDLSEELYEEFIKIKAKYHELEKIIGEKHNEYWRKVIIRDK